MYKALHFFNFGPDIIRWVKTLYADAKLCVIQNGIFSEFFNIGRGCRQGDPVSPYLFNICVEIMGCLLYTSPSPRDLSTSRMPSSA